MEKFLDAVREVALVPQGLVILAAYFWLGKVAAIVPEPYLVRTHCDIMGAS